MKSLDPTTIYGDGWSHISYSHSLKNHKQAWSQQNQQWSSSAPNIMIDWIKTYFLKYVF